MSPSFSRLQDHPEELKHGIEKMLFFITFLTFPIVAGMAVVAPQLVHLIPKYDKWTVALVPLVFYCFNSALAGISTPMTSVLNALGKVKINTYLMIMWTSLTWILTPILAIRYHYSGVAYATAIIALTSFIPVIIVRKYVKFNLISSLLKPAIATLGMIIVSLLFTLLLSQNLVSFVVNILISAMSYLIFSYLIIGPVLFTDTQRLFHAFKHRQA
jgi:O-antigen/teichoic acid export membrane protein